MNASMNMTAQKATAEADLCSENVRDTVYIRGPGLQFLKLKSLS